MWTEWLTVFGVPLVTTIVVLGGHLHHQRGALAEQVMIRRDEVAARAEQQNTWYLSGDPRGFYGDFPPVLGPFAPEKPPEPAPDDHSDEARRWRAERAEAGKPKNQLAAAQQQDVADLAAVLSIPSGVISAEELPAPTVFHCDQCEVPLGVFTRKPANKLICQRCANQAIQEALHVATIGAAIDAHQDVADRQVRAGVRFSVGGSSGGWVKCRNCPTQIAAEYGRDLCQVCQPRVASHPADFGGPANTLSS